MEEIVAIIICMCLCVMGCLTCMECSSDGGHVDMIEIVETPITVSHTSPSPPTKQPKLSLMNPDHLEV